MVIGGQIPRPWSVDRVRPGVSPGKDDLGKPLPAVPKRESVAVSGWAVPRSDEPKLAGHDRLTVDMELLAPVGEFKADDQVDIPGEGLFEVVGRPENYEHSPWASAWTPGTEVVNLRRLVSS